MPGLRSPRVGSNLAQPEITIKPRFDLAADLGVTTAALSQTIRIATLGDIEQNSAKFSLADRQVPIQVSLSEDARRDMQTLLNLPVPTPQDGIATPNFSTLSRMASIAMPRRSRRSPSEA